MKSKHILFNCLLLLLACSKKDKNEPDEVGQTLYDQIPTTVAIPIAAATGQIKCMLKW